MIDAYFLIAYLFPSAVRIWSGNEMMKHDHRMHRLKGGMYFPLNFQTYTLR